MIEGGPPTFLQAENLHTALAILVLQLALLALFLGRPAGAATPDWVVGLREALSHPDANKARNILFAFVVGAMGAWAFHLGVLTGFIARGERPRVLEFLVDPQGRPRSFLSFCFFVTGGIVAGVFQWAQPDTFAPIQAFVLGATWPSVVTRIMAGEGGAPFWRVNPADAPPGQVPTPAGAPAVPTVEVRI